MAWESHFHRQRPLAARSNLAVAHEITPVCFAGFRDDVTRSYSHDGNRARFPIIVARWRHLDNVLPFAVYIFCNSTWQRINPLTTAHFVTHRSYHTAGIVLRCAPRTANFWVGMHNI